jgi:hypothetical protein
MSEDSEHEKLVKEKLRIMDEAERHQTEAVREEMLKFLTEHRGYSPEDIEKDRAFTISVSGGENAVSTDFIISLKGRRFMAVKCAAGSVDSRERHITAFSRVVDEYQIPLCLVTDGEDTRLIDTITAKTVSEDIFSVPSREDALKQIEDMEFAACPPERMEKEKRILLAFESVRCPDVKS